MKVESRINIYEEGVTPTSGLELPQLAVRSHGINGRYVVIAGKGFSVTVVADELTMAIHNATHWKN